MENEKRPLANNAMLRSQSIGRHKLLEDSVVQESESCSRGDKGSYRPLGKLDRLWVYRI